MQELSEINRVNLLKFVTIVRNHPRDIPTEFDIISPERYRNTVAGVVYKNNEFLLVKKPHWGNWWDFVQGGIDKDETLEKTLLRELYEELGVKKFGRIIDTEIKWIRKFSDETTKHYEGDFIGKFLYYFVTEYLGDKNKIVLGDDLCAKKWCNKNELIKLLYKPEIPIAREIMRHLENQHIII